MNLTPEQTTAALFILILCCVVAFTVWLVNLPLTWQTLLAVSATLAFVITAILGYVVLRRKR